MPEGKAPIAWKIAAKGFRLTVRSMGTTVLALGCGLLVVIVPALIKLYQKGWKVGWPAVKPSLIGDAGSGLAVAFIIWLALFIFCLGRATEQFQVSDEDSSSLHQANTILQNKVDALEAKLEQRRLNDEQIRLIARIVKQGLAQQGLNKIDHKIFVQLYTIENDRETATYRTSFEKAFLDGGLGVALGELVGTVGEHENEQFVGAISVLRGSPKNVIRPFVLEALRAAGITPYECDELPLHVARYDHGPGGQSLGVTLIIGQRG